MKTLLLLLLLPLNASAHSLTSEEARSVAKKILDGRGNESLKASLVSAGVPESETKVGICDVFSGFLNHVKKPSFILGQSLLNLSLDFQIEAPGMGRGSD